MRHKPPDNPLDLLTLDGQESWGMNAHPKPRFSAIGLNHGHIYAQVNCLLGAGAEFVSYYAPEAELAAGFAKTFPQARQARCIEEILEDPSIALVTSASIPCERAPLGIQVMLHGKDFLVDKPGILTLEQLEEVRRVQRETRRIYSIFYAERLDNPASVKVGELVKAGAIGQVIQTIGTGPHLVRIPTRPPWFFEKKKYGGILVDIASHQMDQFLYMTGSTRAEVVASQVANVSHPEYPELEDFGDALLSGNGGKGYVRVDWFTPEGLGVWGDARLFVLGTHGYIEARKYIDIAGRPGASHVILVDQKQTRYIDCSGVELPYARQLLEDVRNRTETAMPQAHCFLAAELAIRAEMQARRSGHLKEVL